MSVCICRTNLIVKYFVEQFIYCELYVRTSLIHRINFFLFRSEIVTGARIAKKIGRFVFLLAVSFRYKLVVITFRINT